MINNNGNWRSRRQSSLEPLLNQKQPKTSRQLVTSGFFDNARALLNRTNRVQDVGQTKQNEEGPRWYRYRWIVWFNRFAYFVHGIILASLLIVYATKATSSVSTRLTTNTLFIQWGNSTLGGIGGCLAEKHYAPPNELSFKADDPQCTGSDIVTLSVMPFPKRTDYYLSIVGLTLSFFALSFTFQLATEFIGGSANGKSFTHLYYHMFFLHGDTANKDRDPESMVLRINWLRYVEYSISASIMMLAISLVAGIYDFDLLLCIFFLTWACMLCGYGSEVLIRIRQVLLVGRGKVIEGVIIVNQNVNDPIEGQQKGVSFNIQRGDHGYESVEKKNESVESESQDTTHPIGHPIDKELNAIHEIISNLSLWGAIGMHIVGWVCVFVPWYIIMTHNLSLWGSSDKLSDCLNNIKVPVPSGVPACAVRRTVEPPSFVWGIMISQMLLFLLFGFVQVFQIIRPEKRYKAEVVYIFLSMSAKLILGSFIAAFLFV